MKLLFLGDADSQFIYNYVKWLKKLEPDIEIDIFSTRPKKKVKKEFLKHYNKVYYPYKNTFLPEKVKYLRIIFKPLLTILNFYRINGNYDIVHLLHIHPFYRFGRKKIIKLGGKIVASIWGTDFNRLSEKGIQRVKKLYRSFDVITLANDTIKSRLLKSIPDIEDRILFLHIGLEPFEYLPNILKKYTRTEAKKLMGFDEKRISIAIGYSSKVIHQHLKIIDLIEKSYGLSELSSEIEFVLPITYGTKGAYKKELINRAENSKYKFVIFKDFLSDEETSLLRYSTEIMLQLSTTDHSSGSIREYLYAGTLVIVGTWLPYEPWKKEGIYFEEVDHFEEIEEKLLNLIKNWDRQIVDKELLKTQNTIFQMSSWEHLAPKWLNIYNRLLTTRK